MLGNHQFFAMLAWYANRENWETLWKNSISQLFSILQNISNDWRSTWVSKESGMHCRVLSSFKIPYSNSHTKKTICWFTLRYGKVLRAVHCSRNKSIVFFVRLCRYELNSTGRGLELSNLTIQCFQCTVGIIKWKRDIRWRALEEIFPTCLLVSNILNYFEFNQNKNEFASQTPK